MAIHCHPLPSVANHGRQPSMAIHGKPWPVMASHDQPWLSRLAMTSPIHGHPWPPVASQRRAWQPMPIHGKPWPSMASHDPQWAAMPDHGVRQLAPHTSPPESTQRLTPPPCSSERWMSKSLSLEQPMTEHSKNHAVAIALTAAGTGERAAGPKREEAVHWTCRAAHMTARDRRGAADSQLPRAKRHGEGVSSGQEGH